MLCLLQECEDPSDDLPEHEFTNVHQRIDIRAIQQLIQQKDRC